MSHASHIDIAMVEQLRELLDSRFEELVRRFHDDGERRLTLMDEAITNADFETLYSEAHGLKGSSRNVGAGPLGDICAKLEAIGRAGGSDDKVDMQQTIAACKQEFAAVCAALKAS